MLKTSGGYLEGSYKKIVGRRRDSFDGACCHREALLDDVTGELVLFQCLCPGTFGWVGIFVGLVVVRILKEDFVEGMAMYTDVEFFQGFVASCKILQRQAHTIENELVGLGYRWRVLSTCQ